MDGKRYRWRDQLTESEHISNFYTGVISFIKTIAINMVKNMSNSTNLAIVLSR